MDFDASGGRPITLQTCVSNQLPIASTSFENDPILSSIVPLPISLSASNASPFFPPSPPSPPSLPLIPPSSSFPSSSSHVGSSSIISPISFPTFAGTSDHVIPIISSNSSELLLDELPRPSSGLPGIDTIFQPVSISDTEASVVDPHPTQGKKRRKSQIESKLAIDCKLTIEGKLASLKRLNEKIYVYQIPPDFFSYTKKIACVMMNDSIALPFLVVKTRSLAKGLGSLIYIVSMKKICNMSQVAMNLFSTVPGFKKNYNTKNVKCVDLGFQSIGMLKCIDVIVKILKLFFDSTDMSVILKQFNK